MVKNPNQYEFSSIDATQSRRIKREIDFLHVGTAGQFAKLMFPSKHYEGDEGTPKIKDCYVFKTKVKILFSLTPAWGRAYIVKGDFKIEHPNKT